MSQQFSVTGAGAITTVYVSGTIKPSSGTTTSSTPPVAPFSVTGAGAITTVYIQGMITTGAGNTPTPAPTPAPTTTPTPAPTPAPTTTPTPAPTLAPNEQIDTSITATVIVDFPNITVGGKSSVYIRFSKGVTGVTADMITAINGTLSSFTGNDNLYMCTLNTAGSYVGDGYVVFKGKVADATNPLKVNNVITNDYFSVSAAPTTAPTSANPVLVADHVFGNDGTQYPYPGAVYLNESIAFRVNWATATQVLDQYPGISMYLNVTITSGTYTNTIRYPITPAFISSGFAFNVYGGIGTSSLVTVRASITDYYGSDISVSIGYLSGSMDAGAISFNVTGTMRPVVIDYPAPEHVFDTAKVNFTYLVSDYPSGVVPVPKRDTTSVSVTPVAGLWYKFAGTGDTTLYSANNGDKYVPLYMSASDPVTAFNKYVTLQAGKIGETSIYASKTIGVAYPAATPAPTTAPTPAMPIPVYDHITGAQVGTIPAGGSSCNISASISPPGTSGYIAVIHIKGYTSSSASGAYSVAAPFTPLDTEADVFGVSVTPSLHLVALESESNLEQAIHGNRSGYNWNTYSGLYVTRVDLEPDNTPPPPKRATATATPRLRSTPTITGKLVGTIPGAVADMRLHADPTITGVLIGTIQAVI